MSCFHFFRISPQEWNCWTARWSSFTSGGADPVLHSARGSFVPTDGAHGLLSRRILTNTCYLLCFGKSPVFQCFEGPPAPGLSSVASKPACPPLGMTLSITFTLWKHLPLQQQRPREFQQHLTHGDLLPCCCDLDFVVGRL